MTEIASYILTPLYYIIVLIISNVIILGLLYPIILLIKIIFVNNGWISNGLLPNIIITSNDNLVLFIYCINIICTLINIIALTLIFTLFYYVKIAYFR